MIWSDNLRRICAALGVLGVLATGAWLLPVNAQENPAREREGDAQSRQLRDTAAKLEKLRDDLERQRQALDEQRRALEAQARDLLKAMQQYKRAGQPGQNPATPQAKQDELKLRVDQLLRAQQHVGQPAGKGPERKTVIIRQGGDFIVRSVDMTPPGVLPGKTPPGDIHQRLDQIEQALMKALQEVQNLRRETAQRAPGLPPSTRPAPPRYAPVPAVPLPARPRQPAPPGNRSDHRPDAAPAAPTPSISVP